MNWFCNEENCILVCVVDIDIIRYNVTRHSSEGLYYKYWYTLRIFFVYYKLVQFNFCEKIRIQLCSNGVYLQDDDKERVNRLVKECFRLTQRDLDERRGISSRVE